MGHSNKILMRPRTFFKSKNQQNAYDVGRRGALREVREILDDADFMGDGCSQNLALRLGYAVGRIERMVAIAEWLAALPLEEKADA